MMRPPVRVDAEIADAITAARADLADSPDVPVAWLLTPVPMDVGLAAWRGIDAELHRMGWEAYFRQATGLAIVWARPVSALPPPDQLALPWTDDRDDDDGRQADREADRHD